MVKSLAPFWNAIRNPGRVMPHLSGCLAAYAIGLLFYHHWIVALFIAPFGIMYVPYFKRSREEKRKRLLQMEFANMLEILLSIMHAGHSLESAFRDLEFELRRDAWQAESELLHIIVAINRQVGIGGSIEKIFEQAVKDTEVEDMIAFSRVLQIYKRNGGNMMEQLRRTAELMMERIKLDQEVQVLLARKKLETQLMNAAPYGMIALITLGSPQYAGPLFEGGGRIVMTVALIFIIVGHGWSAMLLRRRKV